MEFYNSMDHSEKCQQYFWINGISESIANEVGTWRFSKDSESEMNRREVV